MNKKFLPPANIDDFSKSNNNVELLKEAWHSKMKNIVDSLVNKVDSDGNNVYPRFFSPLDIKFGDGSIKKTISWSGFPLVIENWLNLNENSTSNEYEVGFQSAEILRPIYISIIKEYENGNVVDQYTRLGDYVKDTVQSMYPVKKGQIDTGKGFALEERIQDEYLEWHVQKDSEDNIQKISFTAEGPGYWETIAQNDPELLTNLYREYISANVNKEDLYWQNDIAAPIIAYNRNTGKYSLESWTVYYKKGEYNPYNVWNTRKGAMHLIQRNNTLGAEVRLAADATKKYKIREDLSNDVDRFDLCACAAYGGINRNSDPHIGKEVNTLAISGFKVTISNPIGLYIGEVQVEGIKDRNGNTIPLEDVLKIERGSLDSLEPRILRFSIIKPPYLEYGLGECSLNNFSLSTGGPIARETSIVIYGQAITSNRENSVKGCLRKNCKHPQRPKFLLPISTKEKCNQIDWNKIESPFQVAPGEVLNIKQVEYLKVIKRMDELQALNRMD